jgi:hypothetical protein
MLSGERELKAGDTSAKKEKAGDTSAKKEKAGYTSAKAKDGDASAAMREPELWELQRMQRRFSIPPSSASDIQLAQQQLRLAGTSEDLHAWSIYRQVWKLGIGVFCLNP